MNEITAFNPTGVEAAETDTMPHSIEAEQQLLGAILTNNDIYDRIAAIIGPQHFYDPVHARIYETAANRIAKNALASPVTLKAFLESDEGLKELGGPAYLARLAGAAISAFAARDYAQMIYDMAIRRELIGLGETVAAKARMVDVDSEPKEQIVEAEQELYKLAEQGTSDSCWSSLNGQNITGHEHRVQRGQSLQEGHETRWNRRRCERRRRGILFVGNVRRAAGVSDSVRGVRNSIDPDQIGRHDRARVPSLC